MRQRCKPKIEESWSVCSFPLFKANLSATMRRWRAACRVRSLREAIFSGSAFASGYGWLEAECSPSACLPDLPQHHCHSFVARTASHCLPHGMRRTHRTHTPHYVPQCNAISLVFANVSHVREFQMSQGVFRLKHFA